MSTTYDLNVTFAPDSEIATWSFDSEGETKCCKVKEGDKIRFTFEGPGEVREGTVLCGELERGLLSSSPFKEGNRIPVENGSVLSIANEVGLWGFSVAFTARNADATTSFYYVPDPEVHVGSKPGSDE